jgi:ABC-type multidrug transport system ATPase subunit
MSEFVIELSALRKAFKGNTALDGLELRVPRGSIFGFLGKNGAGKTTTMKVLMGLMKVDSGTARVFGVDPSGPDGVRARSHIGFVTEDKELYPYMTVERSFVSHEPAIHSWLFIFPDRPNIKYFLPVFGVQRLSRRSAAR